jgi:peroxiredoxin Q/BCP
MADRKVPEVGKKAPAFTLPDATGKKVSLKDHAGKKVVLYFYPKDDTPGCTVEACDFRDRMARLADHGAVVLGVSPDSEKSHAKFATKHKLPFTLLADEERSVLAKYGAWGEKNMYGKKSMGIARSTFIIDKEGVIRKAWKAVKVEGHDEAVMEALKELVANDK